LNWRHSFLTRLKNLKVKLLSDLNRAGLGLDKNFCRSKIIIEETIWTKKRKAAVAAAVNKNERFLRNTIETENQEVSFWFFDVWKLFEN